MRHIVLPSLTSLPRYQVFSAGRVLLLVFMALVLINPANPASAQDTNLQIDGYVDGQGAGFQAGFIIGEIGAVRLTPPGPFPMQVKEVLFLFGGGTSQHDIILRIYDDSAGTVNPGGELFSNTYQVTGSDNAFQSIDLSAENVLVTGPIRVGLEMTHGGLPSIARDNDGNINQTLNFLFLSGTGWVESHTVGLTGDWIIRAVVAEESVPTLPLTWSRIKSIYGH